MTTIGSLFTGYGGLDMGAAMALDPDARVAWTSDVEPGPCKLAQVRWPDTPNLGDITGIDWADVEPVDIICGGSPCQDLSLAGKRAGMAAGTRSGLWESMAAAIETIRPRLVVWENVLGALSGRAYSPVESEPLLLGTGTAGPALRAAGRVVGDLASIGYDCAWRVVRASDAGAPHQRARLFVVGYPNGEPWDVRGPAAPGQAQGGRPQREPARPGVGDLMPTPVAQPSGNTPGEHLRKKPGRNRVTDLAIIVENNLLPTGGLLPTPQAVSAAYSGAGTGQPSTRSQPASPPRRSLYSAPMHQPSPGGNKSPDGQPPTLDSRPTRRRQTTPIRKVRRMDDGPPRRARHRPRPRSQPRTTTTDARQRRCTPTGRARGFLSASNC